MMKRVMITVLFLVSSMYAAEDQDFKVRLTIYGEMQLLYTEVVHDLYDRARAYDSSALKVLLENIIKLGKQVAKDKKKKCLEKYWEELDLLDESFECFRDMLDSELTLRQTLTSDELNELLALEENEA